MVQYQVGLGDSRAYCRMHDLDHHWKPKTVACLRKIHSCSGSSSTPTVTLHSLASSGLPPELRQEVDLRLALSRAEWGLSQDGFAVLRARKVGGESGREDVRHSGVDIHEGQRLSQSEVLVREEWLSWMTAYH